ncbi:hypothetical protein AB0D08_35280 [Kitasatospora sp. NPDC048540]|uniref:WXG100 family type VII secretion target n=1 Tax=Kitasatospora sp. NPDC048540 TaxID=3155634 RepID=UPI0033F035D8
MGDKSTDTGSSDDDFTTDDNGVLFGNPTGGSFHVQDYRTWDWHHIQAAIIGMSNGVSDAANLALAKSVADPQSLQDAADAFYQVQLVFDGVARSLADQGDALAGKDGVWTGDAADSFLDMITLFSRQVGAVADKISGGNSGGNSVPQQLADNAVNLRNAQNKIIEIDNWYANQADLMGYHAMSNGLVPVSKAPGVVELMNRDMRQVLLSLATEYQVTIDKISSPDPITSPLGGGGGTGQPNPSDLPNLTTADGTKISPKSGLGVEPLPTKLDALKLPNLSAAAGKLGDGLGGPKAAVAPFDGGLVTKGAGALGGAPTLADLAGGPLGLDGLAGGPAGFPDGTGTGGPGALDPGSLGAANAGPFAGGTGTDGTGNLSSVSPLPPFDTGGTGGIGGLGSAVPLPGAFPGGTGLGGTGTVGAGKGGIGTGGLGDSLGTADPGTWSSLPPVGAFPGGLGTGGTGNLGSGLTGGKPATFPGGLGTGGTGGVGGGATGGKPVAFPGDLSTSAGLPTGLPGLSTGSDFPGLGQAGVAFPGSLSTGGLGGAGMPFPPGLGGGTGGQPTTTNNERSDASGLLEHNADPWAGSTDVGDDLATHLGTATGGEGLTLPTGTPGLHEGTVPGTGMPFPPGLGSGTGGQPTTTNNERSDASGLLEHNADPWAGSTDVGDDLATHLGTATGGEGLTLPTGTPGLHEATLPGTGMPFPPGLGSGSAGQPTTTNNERSDASGLLEHNAEPWTTGTGGEAAETGTAAGGEGLTLPFLPVEAAAAPERERDGDRERREAGAIALTVGEAAALWAGSATRPGKPGPEDGAEAGPAAAAEDPAEEGAGTEQAPAAVALPAAAGDGEPDTGWDVAGAAFAPLLWAASTEEEADVTAEGPATADEGTWGVPAAAEPSFATWQPNRTGEAAATPAAAALAGAALSCSTEDIAPDPEEEPAEAAQEEAPVRGAADLLVQERDLWGASDAPGLGAII